MNPHVLIPPKMELAKPASVYEASQFSDKALDALASAIRCRKEEKIIFVWSSNRDWEMTHLHKDALVVLTNIRILKLCKGCIKQCKRQDIAAVKHVRKNIWRWDQIQVKMKNGRMHLFGIYDANSCLFMMYAVNDLRTLLPPVLEKDASNEENDTEEDIFNLTILSLNTALITVAGVDPNTHYMLPVKERTPYVCDYLLKQDADVVCLQEIFTNSCVPIIADRMRHKYHHILLPRRERRFMNNGLMLLSKYPILAADFKHYKNGVGDEVFASKGFMAALIQPSGHNVPPFFVYNTHVQAGIGVAGRVGKKMFLKYGSTELIRSEQFASIYEHMLSWPKLFGYKHDNTTSNINTTSNNDGNPNISLFKSPRIFLCGDINSAMNSQLDIYGLVRIHEEQSRRNSVEHDVRISDIESMSALKIVYHGKNKLFNFMKHIPPVNFTNIRRHGAVVKTIPIPKDHFTSTCTNDDFLHYNLALYTAREERKEPNLAIFPDFNVRTNQCNYKGKLIDVICPNNINDAFGEKFELKVHSSDGVSDHHCMKATWTVNIKQMIKESASISASVSVSDFKSRDDDTEEDGECLFEDADGLLINEVDAKENEIAHQVLDVDEENMIDRFDADERSMTLLANEHY